MERLTFNVRPSRRGSPVVAGRAAPTAPKASSPLVRVRRHLASARERYDWDYLWMLAFTALLFLRPQDHVAALESLHLAELTAIAGLAAMMVRRLHAGQTIVKINAEVIAVVVLGGIIVVTIPFSIWPTGSLTVFTEIYVKVILIFALMISTITTPRRLQQMTWVMIVASGYIACRGVIDYGSGVNLVEGDRLGGAVGGMFKNPNDLALNLVTFLAPTLFVIIQEERTPRRLLAGLIAVVMVIATTFTKSRSGFLGLVAMTGVVAYYTARVKPGFIMAVVVAGVLALPAMPASFWMRMDSIVNAEEDPTGSRAARIRLLNQGLEVFAANPLTGVGAGQFQNYNGPGIVEKWRVTHNVWLQVAAELGVFGLLTFAFLVARAYTSCFAALRLLKRPRRQRPLHQVVTGTTLASDEQSALTQAGLPANGEQLTARGESPASDRGRRGAPLTRRDDRESREYLREEQRSQLGAPTARTVRRGVERGCIAGRMQPEFHHGLLSEEDRRILEINAKSMIAGLVGWTVCAFFASVAFNWTFYYVLALAVAGREIVAGRRHAPQREKNEKNMMRATGLVRAHA